MARKILRHYSVIAPTMFLDGTIPLSSTNPLVQGGIRRIRKGGTNILGLMGTDLNTLERPGQIPCRVMVKGSEDLFEG